jgi:hypothetical protein
MFDIEQRVSKAAGGAAPGVEAICEVVEESRSSSEEIRLWSRQLSRIPVVVLLLRRSHATD